ncbi:putative lipid II flippase FtsW [Endozoicomonas sp. GU-1]|uniref:putative lipid II flippase FtsW n=1 Tax=Endozoicomonas sp. GU-1 TaxID=3009078 RepID=UPI0022B39DBD|nr:putative lipid II flippase FtsW [Endozoicomonas sp. GU-1]WBA80232.1 putative lipid II flippase FtsW [Endozoicomonas sp. GU-1]WBA87807.1 putative lipid II flippase FtsW [Endozoicomonas sp. GU-1]
MLKRVRHSFLTEKESIEQKGSRSTNVDMTLFGAVLALLAIGLVMVGSASMDVSSATFGDPFRVVFKQFLFMVVGLGAMGVMMLVPVSRIQQLSWVGLLVAFFLLVLVLIVGREINGSVRWIPLGFFNLQASEVAKLCVVIYLAGYLVRHLDEVRTRWSGFIKPMLVLSGLALLLLAEPDLGALVVLTVAVMGMIFMAGARFHQFLVMIAGVIILIVLLIWMEPYRMARITSYMDPWAHAFGSGYQLTQALIAFGRGAWLGEGLGNSIQKLFYLPEAHTDFVFAVLAEEFGLIGSLLLLGLFLFVAWRSLQLGSRAEARGMLFHGFVAYGIALLFACQALINISVNTGLLPTKGLALPMISYGGSSLIVNCLAFGILLRIDFERRLTKATEVKPVAGRKAQEQKTSEAAGGNTNG